jgi:hypothetical protein
MEPTGNRPPDHTLKKEPKHCRCRICHAHFYGETIAEARAACHAHAAGQHPEWGESACYCPD